VPRHRCGHQPPRRARDLRPQPQAHLARSRHRGVPAGAAGTRAGATRAAGAGASWRAGRPPVRAGGM
ncbi:MAG: hypothetical protein AVDCRST_MAG50-2751, partial [uncultured Acidimicrobiales bacterium]